ncbi:MAG TPA: hypothetical protein VF250_16430, partial [Conexibacter sp.]
MAVGIALPGRPERHVNATSPRAPACAPGVVAMADGRLMHRFPTETEDGPPAVANGLRIAVAPVQHAEPAPGDRLSDLAATLVASEVETVIVAGLDTSGVLRGKCVPVGEIGAALERGVTMCEVIWALPADESAP